MKDNTATLLMERETMEEWLDKENESSLELERQLTEMTYYSGLNDEDAYWDQYGMHIEG